jgi:hypothetical protein
VPFVRDLLDRISSAAPQVRIFAGLPTTAYYGQVVALAAAALLIIAELAQVIVDWRTGSDGAATSLIVIGVLIPPAVGLAKTVFRGSRRRLDPKMLPDDLCGLRLSPQS